MTESGSKFLMRMSVSIHSMNSNQTRRHQLGDGTWTDQQKEPIKLQSSVSCGDLDDFVYPNRHVTSPWPELSLNSIGAQLIGIYPYVGDNFKTIEARNEVPCYTIIF